MIRRPVDILIIVVLLLAGCYGSSSDGMGSDADRLDGGPSDDAGSPVDSEPQDAGWELADGSREDSGLEPTDAGPPACDAGQSRVDGECGPCDAGTFCPGDTEPMPCVESWDHDGDPATRCEPWADCPAGTRVREAGTAVSDRGCEACPPETFSSSPNTNECTAWRSCVPGEFRYEQGTATSDTDCRACLPGFDSASTDAEECTALAFQQVELRSNRICGLHSDGAIHCWGTGSGTPPAGVYSSISVSFGGGCAVTPAGRVACWGAGSGTPPTGPGYRSACGRSSRGCAVHDSDDAVECWGTFAVIPSGTTGTEVFCGVDGPCVLHGDGSLSCWRPETYYGTRPGPFRDVSVEGYAECVLDGEGIVACVGSGLELESPELPQADFSRVFVSGDSTYACGERSADQLLECWGTALEPPPTEPLAQVSLSGYGGCGVTGAGTTLCWGWREGRLRGRPDGRRFQEIALNDELGAHPCGLTRAGHAACLGGSAGDPLPPPDIALRALARGAGHSCAISSADDSVRCWNDGSYTVEAPARAFAELAAHGEGTCGVRRADGRIECWGGHLSPPPDSVTQLRMSNRAICGLRRSDGHPVCTDSFGSLEDTPLEAASQLALGRRHACMLRRDDGRAECWGQDIRGSVVSVPAGPFTSIAAGRDFSCGLRSTGEVECWGDTPWRPETLSGLRIIRAVGNQLCGLRTYDDSLTCLGPGLWNPRQ